MFGISNWRFSVDKAHNRTVLMGTTTAVITMYTLFNTHTKYIHSPQTATYKTSLPHSMWAFSQSQQTLQYNLDCLIFQDWKKSFLTILPAYPSCIGFNTNIQQKSYQTGIKKKLKKPWFNDIQGKTRKKKHSGYVNLTPWIKNRRKKSFPVIQSCLKHYHNLFPIPSCIPLYNTSLFKTLSQLVPHPPLYTTL